MSYFFPCLKFFLELLDPSSSLFELSFCFSSVFFGLGEEFVVLFFYGLIFLEKFVRSFSRRLLPSDAGPLRLCTPIPHFPQCLLPHFLLQSTIP